MKATLTLFLLCIGLCCTGQIKNLRMQSSGSQPLVLVNNTICGFGFYKSLQNALIESMHVYNKKLPEDMKAFGSFLSRGIISIQTTKPLEAEPSFTLQQLNQMNGIAKDNPVEVDGVVISDSQVRVFAKSIALLKTQKKSLEPQLIVLTENNANNYRSIIMPRKDSYLEQTSNTLP